MLRKLTTTLGILLLGSSFAFAAQNTTPTQPATPKAQVQSQKAPAKKHHKKHRKGHKKQASRTPASTTPSR